MELLTIRVSCAARSKNVLSGRHSLIGAAEAPSSNLSLEKQVQLEEGPLRPGDQLSIIYLILPSGSGELNVMPYVLATPKETEN